MSHADFIRELAQIDIDLHMKGTPLVQRPLAAFNVLYEKPDQRGEEAENYFNKIQNWYFEKYGERVAWNGVIGEQPVIIRR